MSLKQPNKKLFFIIPVCLIGLSFVQSFARSNNPVVPTGWIGPYKHGTYLSKEKLTHAGVDIWAAKKSEIFAFADGVVVDVINDPKSKNFNSLGYMVMIRHFPLSNGKTFYTIYLHMIAPPSVKINQEVTGGKTLIGRVGITGAANGIYHTHFEIRHFPTRLLENKAWRFPYNIYGTGNQKESRVFLENWEDPLELFKKYPNGMRRTDGPQPPQPSPQPPIEQPPISKTPTLFLFDVSGSMNENGKINQAREAGLDALREMRAEGGENSSPVSIMTFSGDACGGNVTRNLLGFTSILSQAEAVMRSRLPVPNGGTPLPQAKDAAAAEMQRFLAANPNIKDGRIVLLSDGQSTCGEIRPPGVFSRVDERVSRQNNSKIKFFTIGFDVPPGSVAERDLQYLASVTGGKYFNAADRRQLIRAFQKQVRRYAPRRCNTAGADFSNGMRAFAASDYALALESFRRYADANPNDSCALYNLALAYEANDRYKTAAEYYRQYLSLTSTSPDRAKTEGKIAQLEQDYADQFDYFISLIRSDLDYLKRYYQSIFNRSSRDLGMEFGGFVNEKRDFYAALPEILEVGERWLTDDAKDISSSIDALARRVRLESFDRDAVSLLTVPISQIEDLISRLGDYRASSVH